MENVALCRFSSKKTDRKSPQPGAPELLLRGDPDRGLEPWNWPLNYEYLK